MRQSIKLCRRGILIVCVFALSGCANEILRSDFTNYSQIYGDESNKELLLNLARAANEDPEYYIQLGTISSQYQVTTALQFTGGNTETMTEPVAASSGNIPRQVENALAFNGQANVGMVQTPIFSFVPLTGTNFVQAILGPINDKVYLTFYDQGFEADLVARTIIQRVEWQHICTNGTPTNYSPSAFVIQTAGVDPKVTAYISNLRNLYPNAVSFDTGAYLIRPKELDDKNGLIADITNSVVRTNDITWGINSFIIQKNALSPVLLDRLNKSAKDNPDAISVYVNAITLQTTNIPKDVLSFIQDSLPAGALAVDGIIVDADCVPQSIRTLIANAGLKNAILHVGNTDSISFGSFSPDMVSYITNAIFTNCMRVMTNDEIWINDPGNPTYGKFLKFCADLRNVQVCRMLTVDTLSGGNTTTNVVYGKDRKNPALADVVGAVGANLSVVSDSKGNTVVSQTQLTPHFADKTAVQDFSVYTNLLRLGANTTSFTYDTEPSDLKLLDASNLVQAIMQKRITVTTRTFESAMWWTANQQRQFEEMETNNTATDGIKFTNDVDGLYALVTTTNNVGSRVATYSIKARPTMTLRSDGFRTKPALCSVEYPGGPYRVANAWNDNDRSSGEVFTMLSYLFAQAAISTQNLPVQQLIQVQ